VKERVAMSRVILGVIVVALLTAVSVVRGQEAAASPPTTTGVAAILQTSDRALIASLSDYLAKNATAADREQAYMVIFERAIENDWYIENEATARQYLKEMPDGTVAPLARIVGTMSRARRGQFDSAVEDFRVLVMGLDQPDQEEFAANFADSLAGAALAAGETSRAKQVYEMLGKQFPASPTLAQKVGDELARIAVVGAPAPKIKARTLDGKPLTFEDFKGKYVLVDFWATWCVPNVVDLPKFQAIRDRWGAKGFEIVSVSLDENLQAVTDFVASKKLAWPQLHQGTCEADLISAFKVGSIPARFLIGPDGTVLRTGLDPASLEGALGTLMLGR
jgi:thiol-disulfide isomerase/thioredoxin